jgi:hypothetical protein
MKQYKTPTGTMKSSKLQQETRSVNLKGWRDKKNEKRQKEFDQIT